MATQMTILRTTRRYVLAGLAAALVAFAMPSIAVAQRAAPGDVWGETLEHGETRLRAGRQECSPIEVRPRAHRSGRYELRYERVWVPATTRQEWVPARYGYHRLPCGLRVRHVICQGHYRTVHVPGFHDRRAVKVWVPARRWIRGHDRYDGNRVHRVSHIGRRR